MPAQKAGALKKALAFFEIMQKKRVFVFAELDWKLANSEMNFYIYRKRYAEWRMRFSGEEGYLGGDAGRRGLRPGQIGTCQLFHWEMPARSLISQLPVSCGSLSQAELFFARLILAKTGIND